MTRDELIGIVKSWVKTGDPEAGILMDALVDYGFDLDEGLGTLSYPETIRFHLTSKRCAEDGRTRSICYGIRFILNRLGLSNSDITKLRPKNIR